MLEPGIFSIKSNIGITYNELRRVSIMSNATGSPLQTPLNYWDKLLQSDLSRLCRRALAQPIPPGRLVLTVLNIDIMVDLQKKKLLCCVDGIWQNCKDELLELVVLVYLLQVAPVPLSGDLISVSDLKDAHFFQGPHDLNTDALLERFGHDPDAFGIVARKLGGEPVNMADAAFRILPLPRVPTYYLLWQGDDEFAPKLTVLFDRSIEQLFAADAIWGLVNMVNDRLLKTSF